MLYKDSNNSDIEAYSGHSLQHVSERLIVLLADRNAADTLTDELGVDDAVITPAKDLNVPWIDVE